MMLSENINLACFGDDIERPRRVEVGTGEFERQPKGSITLLQEWLTSRHPDIEATTIAAIIEPLRKVRELRQKPAHAIQKAQYDKRFYKMQDELVWKVCRALNALWHLLMRDEAASGYDPPFWDGRLTVKSY